MLKEVKQTEEEIRIGKLCYQYRIDNNLELYEDEIWKFIEGEGVKEYSDEYLVSNMGWVASYKKGKIRSISKGAKTKINNSLGYMRTLKKHDKNLNVYVHRLVAQVFCYNDNPKEKTIVNHIIERTETECDNRACNLEWCTYQQNALHSSYKSSDKNKGNNNGKKTRVRCVETGEIFNSIAEASKSVNCNSGVVCNSINKGYKARGLHWEYVDEEEMEPLQLEGEIWKDIEGYEGLYEVSNLGRVKSLNYNKTSKEKILKLGLDSKGYMRIGLCKNKKSKSYSVHRLVAKTFCDGYEEGLVVNHKNHIRDDNRACNLEWVTYEENNKHGYRNPNPKTQKVICITTKEIFNSIKEGSIKYSINVSGISQCCNGKKITIGKLKDDTPLVWRKLDDNGDIIFLDSDYEDIEKIAMIDKNTDEIIKIFDSIAMAYEYLGKNKSGGINDCLSNNVKTIYGYKWKRIKVKNNFIEYAIKTLEEIKSINNL